MSLVPAGGGARVCHKGREDSTGSADRSIKSAELVLRCPLTEVTWSREYNNSSQHVRRVPKSAATCDDAKSREGIGASAKRPHGTSRAKVYERNDLEGLGNKASQNVSGALWVAASVPRTGTVSGLKRKKTAREGTPGLMNEKNTANCRQKEHTQPQGDREAIHTRSGDSEQTRTVHQMPGSLHTTRSRRW